MNDFLLLLNSEIDFKKYLSIFFSSYGLGPIPDSYFVDPENAMPDYDQLTTVYAGDKHLIQIKVKKPSKIK